MAWGANLAGLDRIWKFITGNFAALAGMTSKKTSSPRAPHVIRGYIARDYDRVSQIVGVGAPL
jgi:hypothetical protein